MGSTIHNKGYHSPKTHILEKGGTTSASSGILFTPQPFFKNAIVSLVQVLIGSTRHSHTHTT